jgi:hypothetical protein
LWQTRRSPSSKTFVLQAGQTRMSNNSLLITVLPP